MCAVDKPECPFFSIGQAKKSARVGVHPRQRTVSIVLCTVSLSHTHTHCCTNRVLLVDKGELVSPNKAI